MSAPDASAPSGLVIWADGRLVDPDAPVLAAVDHGVTVGDGVFETCAVVDGTAFALSRHLRRLARSATGLGLPAPDLARVRDAAAEVLGAPGGDTGRLRITVTAGPGPLGSGRLPGALSLMVVAGPGARVAEARAVRVPWTRNERSAVAGLKTTSYAENVVALAYAVERGGDEALFANTRGELCEGTGSNVFVEREGELITPGLATGCLAGITRELVLEWAQEEGLPVREGAAGELPFSVLDDVAAGSAFLGLSSSTRDLVPVVSLDGAPLEPGPLTMRVRTVFLRRMADDLDP